MVSSLWILSVGRSFGAPLGGELRRDEVQSSVIVVSEEGFR